jgi:3,4-dihydroxy 2-butanone 4-phosphate synthase/GTP cyclohydrolase II
LRARPGGVLKRAGHTEAAVDLARLAGCQPAGIICEIQNDDGTMMRLNDLRKFCNEHGLLLSSIAQLIEYRRHHERLVERMGEATVPPEFGSFTCVAYRSTIDGVEHLAFVKGEVSRPKLYPSGLYFALKDDTIIMNGHGEKNLLDERV